MPLIIFERHDLADLYHKYFDMNKKIILLILLLEIIFPLQRSFGHCDTKDGPVILAAQKALSTGNVNLILIWVQPKDESTIKEIFKKTLELRKVSPEVRMAIDNCFFETVVRIHRAGEGVAYTGLKDSIEVEVPIAESDKALESGSLTEVMKLLNEIIQEKVNEKFKDAISKRDYDPNNIAAGRESVESYVTFIHYVEGIYNAANIGEGIHQGHEEENISGEHQISLSPENCNQATAINSTFEYKTHFLIIGGTLLIIIVQIVLYRIKK